MSDNTIINKYQIIIKEYKTIKDEILKGNYFKNEENIIIFNNFLISINNLFLDTDNNTLSIDNQKMENIFKILTSLKKIKSIHNRIILLNNLTYLYIYYINNYIITKECLNSNNLFEFKVITQFTKDKNNISSINNVLNSIISLKDYFKTEHKLQSNNKQLPMLKLDTLILEYINKNKLYYNNNLFVNLLLIYLEIIKYFTLTKDISHNFINKNNILILSNIFEYYINNKTNNSEDIILLILNIFRNLTIYKILLKDLINIGIIGLLITAFIKLYNNKLILNDVLRIFSKLSNDNDFVAILFTNNDTNNIFYNLLKDNINNNFIIIRIIHILANYISYCTDKSLEIFDIYFDISFKIFEEFITKNNKEENNYELMLKSFVKFDFLDNKDKSVIEKLMNLFTNLFSNEEISLKIINNKERYKYFLKNIRFFIKDTEIESNPNLLINTFICLSNILYYDKAYINNNDFELNNYKLDLVNIISYVILQPDNDDVLIEGLRVIINLSNTQNFDKIIINNKFILGVELIINHPNKEICYLDLGLLLNLIKNDYLLKNINIQTITTNISQLITKLDNNDYKIFEIIYKIYKAIINNKIINNNKNVDKLLFTINSKIDNIIKKYSNDKNISDNFINLRNLYNN